MSTLYLVRHGQASFGAADYDALSALGHRQSVRLGEYWRERGLRFDAVFTGTLKRHRQTWAGIAQGLGADAEAVERRPGLNEYDSDALLAALRAEPLDAPPALDQPERYRAHFRLLRDALTAWMAARIEPVGMPSWVDFLRGVTDALDHVRDRHHGKKVLVVSSGGPIATAVAHVLGAPTAAAIELNLRLRNTAVSEFAFTPKRHALLTFNTLPHLDGAAYEGWETYA